MWEVWAYSWPCGDFLASVRLLRQTTHVPGRVSAPPAPPGGRAVPWRGFPRRLPSFWSVSKHEFLWEAFLDHHVEKHMLSTTDLLSLCFQSHVFLRLFHILLLLIFPIDYSFHKGDIPSSRIEPGWNLMRVAPSRCSASICSMNGLLSE